MFGYLIHLVFWLMDHHPRVVFYLVIVAGVSMLMRSMVRAFQRWEIIPDPLLPERWRRRVNAVEAAALEASADERNYRPYRGSSGGSSNSGGFSGGGGSFGGGESSGSF